MDTITYLTQEKHAALTAELNDLITAKRPEIAQQLEHARSLGDLSENAEYQQARQLQGEVESRIKYLARILKSAQIVSKHHSSMVDIGATVTVRRAGEKDTATYTIVGSEEADTLLGRISLNSPLGQAMMGKKKGDEFTFVAPTGKKIEYAVVKID